MDSNTFACTWYIFLLDFGIANSVASVCLLFFVNNVYCLVMINCSTGLTVQLFSVHLNFCYFHGLCRNLSISFRLKILFLFHCN